jgi:hypothetical protein
MKLLNVSFCNPSGRLAPLIFVWAGEGNVLDMDLLSA